jgi:hypothetical protein
VVYISLRLRSILSKEILRVQQLTMIREYIKISLLSLNNEIKWTRITLLQEFKINCRITLLIVTDNRLIAEAMIHSQMIKWLKWIPIKVLQTTFNQITLNSTWWIRITVQIMNTIITFTRKKSAILNLSITTKLTITLLSTVGTSLQLLWSETAWGRLKLTLAYVKASIKTILV